MGYLLLSSLSQFLFIYLFIFSMNPFYVICAEKGNFVRKGRRERLGKIFGNVLVFLWFFVLSFRLWFQWASFLCFV